MDEHYRYRRYKCLKCPHKFTTFEFEKSKIETIRIGSNKFIKVVKAIEEIKDHGRTK